MFNKLNFDQLSRFYGVISELETCYGKGKVREVVTEMANRLDNEAGNVRQMSLFDESEADPEPTKGDDAKKKKRVVVKDRKPKGQNDQKIREWSERSFPGMTADESMLWMYYKKGMKQSEIGGLIGVNQRAVSQFLNAIPEIRKRKIMAGWGTTE